MRISPAVVRATPAEMPPLAAVLARAFRHDPMVVWPLVSADDLEARIERHFLVVDTAFAGEGWMYTAGDGAGVMSLIPPGVGDRQRAVEASIAPALAALVPDGGARYDAFWAWIDATVPDEPHWLLDQLVVDPPAQGRGIGAAMLAFALDRGAADGVPVFLETSSVRNVGYYEQFGFAVMHDADAPGGGPHIWFMRRDPGRRRRDVSEEARAAARRPRRPRGRPRRR